MLCTAFSVCSCGCTAWKASHLDQSDKQVDYIKYPVTAANTPSAEWHRQMQLTQLTSLELPAIKHFELRRQWTCAVQRTGVLPLTQENAFDLHSVGSLLNTLDGPRGTKSIERVTVTAWRKLFNKYWSPIVSASFVTILQSNLTTQNNTQNNCIILQAQNATAFQASVFLTEIQCYLDRHKGRSAFYSANYCQGQPKSSQSVSIEQSKRVSRGRQQSDPKIQGSFLIVITYIIKLDDNCWSIIGMYR
jgi:hypothetical protein